MTPWKRKEERKTEEQYEKKKKGKTKIVEKAMLDIRDLGLPWHDMTMQCSSNVEAAFLTDYTNVAKSHWTANLKPNCQKILAELVGMHLIGFNWMPELAPICHIKELTFAPLPCKIALFCKNAPTMCIKCWSHFTFSCFSPPLLLVIQATTVKLPKPFHYLLRIVVVVSTRRETQFYLMEDFKVDNHL